MCSVQNTCENQSFRRKQRDKYCTGLPDIRLPHPKLRLMELAKNSALLIERFLESLPVAFVGRGVLARQKFLAPVRRSPVAIF